MTKYLMAVVLLAGLLGCNLMGGDKNSGGGFGIAPQQDFNHQTGKPSPDPDQEELEPPAFVYDCFIYFSTLYLFRDGDAVTPCALYIRSRKYNNFQVQIKSTDGQFTVDEEFLELNSPPGDFERIVITPIKRRTNNECVKLRIAGGVLMIRIGTYDSPRKSCTYSSGDISFYDAGLEWKSPDCSKVAPEGMRRYCREMKPNAAALLME